jgi:alkylhydroperoxidase family enzyme
LAVLAATKPHKLTNADYQHLQEFGLDQEEIFELIATANLFTALNQYTDAIALEIDDL